MKHIPNILSFLRLLMVFVFYYFFQSANYLAALGIYVLAILTDLLDGYLARRNNWVSDLGKVLDPLADKLMLMTTLLCFYLKNWLPLWLLILIVAKELIMIIGGTLLLKKHIVVYADWYGKFATGFFNLAIVATFCKNFWAWIGIWNYVLLGIAVLFSIIALVHYGVKNVVPYLKHRKDDPTEK